MIPESVIPGLQELTPDDVHGKVSVFRARDEMGHEVRAFVSDEQDVRHRLKTWAGIEPRSRWVETESGGALVCRWEELAPSQDRPAGFDQDPRSALEACLGCLDELARFHELGMSHGHVHSRALHLFHGRFVLNPPTDHDQPGGREKDLANAKRLLGALLNPPSSRTISLASQDSDFLARALEVVHSDHDSVASLRDDLRKLFGSERDCPTIVGGQPSFALTQLNIPSSIDGYQIRSLIGRGGMGYVFEAYDPQLDRELAVKTVRLELLGEAGKERFIREARACSSITHPNVVTVYAAGEYEGDPYMAMELIRGRSMATILEEDAPPWPTIVRWAVSLLDALEKIHSIGIVHRDLKPENILFTRGGIPKLMDFGLAHMESSSPLTATGTIVGTAHYMSPEQVLGKDVDARSDVFSMGVVLFRALSGELPFQGQQQMSVMYAIAHEEAPHLDTESLGIPPSLREILDRAMAKDRDERFASAGPFRDALLDLIGEERTAGYPHVPFRRWPWVAGAAAVGLLAAATAWMLTPSHGYDRTLAEQHNELASEFQQRNDLKSARAEYRKALVADPTYATAWNNLAVLAIGDGNVDLADSLLRRALEADPGFALAQFNRGWIAEREGDRDQARSFYESALASDSTQVRAYIALSDLLVDDHAPTEARRVLDRALRLPTISDTLRPYLWRSSGRIRAATGDLQGAIEDWRRALAGLPDDPRLHEFLAKAFQQLGDDEAARTHWQRLLDLGNAEQRQLASASLGVD